MVEPRCFLPQTTTKFSPQNGEKTERGISPPTCWLFFFFFFDFFLSLLTCWLLLFFSLIFSFYGIVLAFFFSFFFTLMKCPFILFFFKYNVFFFVLFNRNMMLNLYKLYFQPNKKNFHPSTFPPPSQTKMRETKNFSILPLFHSLSIFYLLIFSTSQPNRP